MTLAIMKPPSGHPVRVHFDGWTLDSETRELRRGGEPVHLSPKAFRLLEALIEHRPAAVSKKKLMDTIWPNTFVDESNLASLIKENRTALHDDAREPKIIRTIFGHGYAFATEATTEKPPKARLESIAVLPFANLSGAEWDYVSDGIADALLNKLTDLRSIRVVPRSTSFRYRSTHPDIKSAAAEMRVEAMVTGRVSEREGALTIQVELINTKTDSQLWGGRFHGPSSGLQDLQRQVESEIIVRVVEHAAADDRRSPAVRDSEAYHRYLRGRHQLNRRDAEGFRRAIEEFRGAIEMDGGFAQAHAALAETYAALGSR